MFQLCVAPLATFAASVRILTLEVVLNFSVLILINSEKEKNFETRIRFVFD